MRWLYRTNSSCIGSGSCREEHTGDIKSIPSKSQRCMRGRFLMFNLHLCNYQSILAQVGQLLSEA